MSEKVDHHSPWRWITRFALGLVLTIVITRLTTEEIIRDPWEVVPHGIAAPRAPGAGAGLVLDLLSTLPALAILLRAAFDPSYRLRHRWSYLPMFALGLLAVASTWWSSDRFLAAVTASHLLAGLCLLWATSQLIRSWLRFRLVAAVCFGLLLILVVQSVIYRTIDTAENVRYWNDNKESILKEHGWQPDSFAAQQFEHKLRSGDLASFFNSPNTFAAVGVLLFVVSAGLGIQKLMDGESKGWLAIPLISAASVIWIITEAQSKTAAATPVLALLMFLAVFKLRSKLQERPSHREARLCCARSPDVADSIYGATLGSVNLAGLLWHETACAAGMGNKTHVHGLGDGAPWIMNTFQEQFGAQGKFTVDFWHVSEYLAQAAPVVAPGKNKEWLHRQQDHLLLNQVDAVLGGLENHREPAGKPDTPVRTAYGYLQARRDHLDYAGAKAAGLPIGSGEVESGHRHVLQERLKISGAWWLETTVQAMLQLRVKRANKDWETYWAQIVRN